MVDTIPLTRAEQSASRRSRPHGCLEWWEVFEFPTVTIEYWDPNWESWEETQLPLHDAYNWWQDYCHGVTEERMHILG